MSGPDEESKRRFHEWLNPEPPKAEPPKDEAPNVYSWLRKNEFDECYDQRTGSLYALEKRWHHFPVTLTETECAFNAFEILGATSNSGDVVILEITMVQAQLGRMELISGTHKKDKKNFRWLVETDNPQQGADSKRICLTNSMYRSYSIHETEYVKERIVPLPSGGFTHSD